MGCLACSLFCLKTNHRNSPFLVSTQNVPGLQGRAASTAMRGTCLALRTGGKLTVCNQKILALLVNLQAVRVLMPRRQERLRAQNFGLPVGAVSGFHELLRVCSVCACTEHVTQVLFMAVPPS